MAKVIKKSGEKEAFNPEDVRTSISKAMEEAGLSIEEKREKIDGLVNRVRKVAEEKGEMHTERIREMILSELDDTEPTAAESWRKYDSENK